MNDDFKERLQNRLEDYVNLITSPSKGNHFYVCPLCSSGDSGRRGSDGAFHVKENRWKCFSCGESGDIFNLIESMEGITDFPEQIKFAADRLGEWVPDQVDSKSKMDPVKKSNETKSVSAEQWKPFEENLQKSPEGMNYLKERGFSDETISRFHLGYDKDAQRVVIPYPGLDFATGRAIDEKAEKKYLYPTGKALPLFTIKESDADFYYITEGQLDAISLYQAGARNIIAIGGGSADLITGYVREHNMRGAVIVADSDPEEKRGKDGLTPGERIAKNISENLSKFDIVSITVFPEDGHKDSNDMLRADPESLAELIKLSYFELLEEAERLREPTSQESFDDFLAEVMTDRFEPISTGIDQLDKALSGGLERKTLVTLAAAPGAGKTAIAQYLLENMAEKGHNVVYVNLEMDRSQLLSRSIARLSHERSLTDQRAVPNTRNHLPQSVFADIFAIDVRRGYKWTDEQKAIVEKTAAYYREHIAPHFQYVTTNPENRGSIDNTLSSILRKLEAITAELIRNGQNAPLVCIDYLQFVEYDLLGEKERKPDNAEAIKQTLKAFKQFAMKYNTVVILITANNRASNSEGRASMDSARDTSNIEYSGDVMLSLVYTAVEERWTHRTGKTDRNGNDTYAVIDNDYINHVIDWTLSENKSYPDIAKRMSLKVVKGRGIQSRGVAKFKYDGRYFYFEPDTDSVPDMYRRDQGEDVG